MRWPNYIENIIHIAYFYSDRKPGAHTLLSQYMVTVDPASVVSRVQTPANITVFATVSFKELLFDKARSHRPYYHSPHYPQ